MQPYLFPYIGYYQLVSAVDKFVIFDDVNFINKGWINRNRILVNGEGHLFTMPVSRSSQNKLINEIELTDDYSKWKEKFLKTLKNSYSKAPYFNTIYSMLTPLMDSSGKNLSEILRHILYRTVDYLQIETEMIHTSSVYDNANLKGQDRILDICKKENASEYLNPIGGKLLYNKEKFLKENINLYFLESGNIEYKQFSSKFVSNLSIIDIMMFNSPDEIKTHLVNYSLI